MLVSTRVTTYTARCTTTVSGMTSVAAGLRLVPLVLILLLPGGAPRAQAPGGVQATTGSPAVETVLQSRNKVVLGVTGKSATLIMTIRSSATGRRLKGEIAFALSAEEPLEKTDTLTCAASLTFGCGVVARFSTARRKSESPSVFEAQLDDGTLRITSDGRQDRDTRSQESRPDPGKAGNPGDEFEKFVAALIENAEVAVKVRVDQQQEFLFDTRRLSWPLADFPPEHPFSMRFAGDPVLSGLKQRFPSQYLRIVNIVRQVVPDAGALPPEAEVRILEAMHGAVGSLRPMVPDDLLERVVANADAAARQIGSRDTALCNALAVAARSPVTVPELKDTAVAREELSLWRQMVEQAHPRFIRKVPNESLLPSTPRFEENMRVANESGCGMFAAVIEAILKLPRDERRLWLRATVGTVEDLRDSAPAARR
jgi:hypothetical protein